MDHFQLSDYNVEFWEKSNQFLVLVRGSRYYSKILATAFADKSMSSSFRDNSDMYDWGLFLRNVKKREIDVVKDFLALLHEVVCLQDDLTQCYALAYHKHQLGRTEIGDLVHAAKPYSRPVTQQHKEHGAVLSKHFIDFIQRHPTYRTADLLMSVPAIANKKFDLPSFIVGHVLDQVNLLDGRGFVEKTRTTKPIKDCTPQEKTEILQDVFVVNDVTAIKGKKIILLDDIYLSGVTMNTVASVLINAGAAQVLGLVATKAGR